MMNEMHATKYISPHKYMYTTIPTITVARGTQQPCKWRERENVKKIKLHNDRASDTINKLIKAKTNKISNRARTIV